MSVTDPLIKSLKYLIEEFYSVGEPVADASPYLAPFCQTIEHAFTQGIKLGPWDSLKQDNQSMRRKQFWALLEHFETSGPIPLSLSNALNAAYQNRRLKHADGRVRHVIRHCLARKTMHVLVEFLITRKRDIDGQWYHENNETSHFKSNERSLGTEIAIVTNEPLAEQFRSLLMTSSSSLTFDLDQKNGYFLDHTWNIPDMRTVEFVPTQELGLGIIYIDGHGIINKTKEGSVAADAKEIGVGDLIVEMNGIPLYPLPTNGASEIMNIWKKCRRKEKPCRLTIIKPRCPATGGVFNPLRQVLTEYQDIMEEYYDKRQKKIEQKLREAEEQRAISLSPDAVEKGKMPVADGRSGCGCYTVSYIGEVLVGGHGGMSQIEGVIKSAVRRRSPLTILNVILEITEISVITRSTCIQTRKAVPTMDLIMTDNKVDEGNQDVLEDVDSMTCSYKQDAGKCHEASEATGPNTDKMSPSRRNGGDCLFSHKFADISSCGKIITDEKHFCYIAGDTFCTISKQFRGYVFEARSVSQARLILNNIYQGFKRTTFFM